MPTISLPPDPSLAALRRDARRLQRRVRDGDAEARALVAGLHPGPPPDLDTFPLHAAQLVLARRCGFLSWPRLKHYLDVAEPYRWRPGDGTADEPVADRFCRLACLTFDTDGPDRWAAARALLDATPGLVADHVWAAAAANDLPAVTRLIGSATRRGGPYGWTPLGYLAYSRLDPDVPAEPVLEIARLLLDAGADPNEGYLWRGQPTPFTLLTGVLGGGEANQPPHPHASALAGLLLAAGADANDGQALYNRMFGTSDEHLRLLFDYGLGTRDGGVWRQRLGEAADSPATMLRDLLWWAIVHDQRDRVSLLVANGVTPTEQLRDGRLPAESAALAGYSPDYLVELGAPAPVLDAADTFTAEALRGAGVPGGSAALARRRRPGLAVWAATLGRADAIRVILAHGFDVNARGRGDAPLPGTWETALHVAAGTGNLALVRLLVESGADPSARDARFDGTPLDWARHFDRDDVADYLATRGQ